MKQNKNALLFFFNKVLRKKFKLEIKFKNKKKVFPILEENEY